MTFSPAATLTPQFEQRLLKRLNGEFASADNVLALSDFYHQHPGQETPWSEPKTSAAYLSYFLPLNVARLRAVWHEVRRFLKTDEIQEIWDFGSGIGAVQWVIEDEAELPARPFYCQEISKTAIEVHKELIACAPARFHPQFNTAVKPQAGALAVFSYSYLEIKKQLPSFKDFSHVLIVEPSTRDCGRELMAARKAWIAEGFAPLAPCTHSQDCPLLSQSGRDWCHMRVAFNAPAWFEELESRLPMKNRTLTYSYLLMSRTATDPNYRGASRVIGDTLEERGKTRQLICRGPQREFLSWLHREGPPPRIPHGAILKDIGSPEVKGTELRAAHDLKWEI